MRNRAVFLRTGLDSSMNCLPVRTSSSQKPAIPTQCNTQIRSFLVDLVIAYTTSLLNISPRTTDLRSLRCLFDQKDFASFVDETHSGGESYNQL